MKTILFFILLTHLTLCGKAQYIDRLIMLSNSYYGDNLAIDVDSDGQDDFKFDFISIANHPVISLHANAKMLVFSTNHTKVKVLGPNQTISTSMTGGDYVSQISAHIEQQYTYNFSFTTQTSSGYIYDGGYMAVMVNNRIGYVVFNADYQSSYATTPSDGITIWFSRLTDLTSLTTELNNYAVGITDLVKTSNLFTLTSKNQVLFSDEMAKQNYTYTISDLFGRTIEGGIIKDQDYILQDRNLVEGMYVLNVFEENQLVEAKKFMYRK